MKKMLRKESIITRVVKWHIMHISDVNNAGFPKSGVILEATLPDKKL